MALQIKRNLRFEGSLHEAISAIAHLEPKLSDGEPLLCRYKENESYKYFVCIGVGNGSVRVLPSYNDIDELIAFIQNNAQKLNIIDSISDKSDLSATTDSDGKVILKLKDTINN